MNLDTFIANKLRRKLTFLLAVISFVTRRYRFSLVLVFLKGYHFYLVSVCDYLLIFISVSVSSYDNNPVWYSFILSEEFMLKPIPPSSKPNCDSCFCEHS